MTSNTDNTTRNLVQRIYAEFGFTKTNKEDLFSAIAKEEIKKIIAAQKSDSYTPSNYLYTEAGFKATNITPLIVQNQISSRAL